MDVETLGKDEVLEIFATVQKRPSRGSYTGVGKRLPSDRPPVMTPAELGLTKPGGVTELIPSTTAGQGSRTNGAAHGNGGGLSASSGNGSGTAQVPPDDSARTAEQNDGGATPAEPASNTPKISNPWAPPTLPNDDRGRR